MDIFTHMYRSQTLLWKILCLGLLYATYPQANSQENTPSSEDTQSTPNTYSKILDTIYVLPSEEVAELFEEEIGHRFTTEEQTSVANTLRQMRYQGKGTRSFFRAYFQSIEYGLSSGRVTGSTLTNLLEVLGSTSSSYNPHDYKRLLRFLVRFFNTGTIYVAPKQTWKLQSGGDIDFSFDVSKAPSPTTEEVPLLS